MVAQPLPELPPSEEHPGSQDTPPVRRLYRSRRDRMLAGVAGGLAQYFNLDPMLVRLAFVLMTIFSGIGLVAYIILAVLTPEVPDGHAETGPDAAARVSLAGSQAVGIGLIVLGLLWLAGNFGLLSFLQWRGLFPVVLVALGVWLVLTRRHEAT